MTNQQKAKPYWVNIIFFAITPIIAIVGMALNIADGGPHPATLAFAVFMLFATGMAITGGYHRLFSHRTYQASWIVRLLFTLFGSASFQGSVMWWAAEHRIHHRFEDTAKDPYGIQKGFWFAHIGWLLEKREDASMDLVKDLARDPILRWQQRLYIPIAALMCFGFPALVASLWGDPWGGLLYAGVVRMVINHHGTFSINSFCHLIGKKTYDDELTARDSWITALITYGEGYHNFHHHFMADYRNGIRAYQYDPTKWLIAGLSGLGLASNLKRANKLNILQARLHVDRQAYWDKLASCSDIAAEKAQEMLEGAQVQLQQAQQRWLELKGEYREIKRLKVASMQDQLAELKHDLREAKLEFQTALLEWTVLIKDPITALA